MAVSVVAANLQAVLGLLADVSPPWPDPDYALIPARRQYNALPILKALEENLPRTTLRLGLLNMDLCLPILSYVLGEAQVNGRAAVVSLFRLKEGRAGKAVPAAQFYERLAKVALHETAHVLGLRHCRETGCLMCFSLGVEQLDTLSTSFCPTCEHVLHRVVLTSRL
ncbi:MAG: peptidase M54 [Thermodesulfobacteriota bacterium]